MDIEKTTHGQVFDMAIIGSGPAGMAAGLYGARAGLGVVVFERIAPGGQLGDCEHIDNYPGFPDGSDGFELADAMKKQCDRFGVNEVNEEVVSVELSGEIKKIETSFGTYKARSVIIATGASPRELNLELEEELQGKGVSYCATCDGNFFAHKEVMVTGGGNTAAMDALYLARICKKVYLVHRRDKLRATAVYHQAIEDLENIVPIWHATPSKLIAQEGKLAGVRIHHLQTGEMEDIEVEGLFVAIGSLPNTGFLGDAVELDEAGYIVAGENCETSVPGVYAAGDIRTKPLRQVVTAVADGANAAETAAEYLMS